MKACLEVCDDTLGCVLLRSTQLSELLAHEYPDDEEIESQLTSSLRFALFADQDRFDGNSPSEN